jgi:serine/threonine protein kinase
VDAKAWIGKVLHDTYKIETLLDSGGMGAVFEASHSRLTRRFAIKVLATRIADEESVAYARFQREAEITSKLGHPNIVEVFDYNRTDDGSPYIVMELLEGESLARRFAKLGRMEPEQVLPILVQIASALEAAHAAKVVHRDLKPKNIFISSVSGGDEIVKVFDFGISKVVDSGSDLTQTSALIGTPRYMSPEQADGRSDEVNFRCDIYAMGVILYELLAGHPPFMSNSTASLLHMIVYQEINPPHLDHPHISEEIGAVLCKAMAKKPDDRYPSMSALAKALGDAMGEPVTTSKLMLPADVGVPKPVNFDDSFDEATEMQPTSSTNAQTETAAVPVARPLASHEDETLVPDAPAIAASPAIQGRASQITTTESKRNARAVILPNEIPGPIETNTNIEPPKSGLSRVLLPLLVLGAIAAAIYFGLFAKEKHVATPAGTADLSAASQQDASPASKHLDSQAQALLKNDLAKTISDARHRKPTKTIRQIKNDTPGSILVQTPLKTKSGKTIPSWANVYVDGLKAHRESPVIIRKVKPGRRKVMISRKGFPQQVKSVNVEPGKQTRVVIPLTEK